jgi:hypothetical protein
MGVAFDTLQKYQNRLKVKYQKESEEQKKVEEGRKKLGVH